MNQRKQDVFRAFALAALMVLALVLVVASIGCGPTNKVSNQDDQIRQLQLQLQNQFELLAALENSMADIEAVEAAMQLQINSLIVELASLQDITTVIGVIDPCGDSPGRIDEILLQLSGGRVLTSFADNGNARTVRLALMPSGSYTTTDGTNCHFTVNDGVVSW